MTAHDNNGSRPNAWSEGAAPSAELDLAPPVTTGSIEFIPEPETGNPVLDLVRQSRIHQQRGITPGVSDRVRARVGDTQTASDPDKSPKSPDDIEASPVLREIIRGAFPPSEEEVQLSKRLDRADRIKRITASFDADEVAQAVSDAQDDSSLKPKPNGSSDTRLDRPPRRWNLGLGNRK